jgi:hypothetical protein
LRFAKRPLRVRLRERAGQRAFDGHRLDAEHGGGDGKIATEESGHHDLAAARQQAGGELQRFVGANEIADRQKYTAVCRRIGTGPPYAADCGIPAAAENYTITPNTTLADLLTRLLDANPFSTVRASFRWQVSDERDDGVADGRQAWLRRRSIDSFFPASLF